MPGWQDAKHQYFRPWTLYRSSPLRQDWHSNIFSADCIRQTYYIRKKFSIWIPVNFEKIKSLKWELVVDYQLGWWCCRFVTLSANHNDLVSCDVDRHVTEVVYSITATIEVRWVNCQLLTRDVAKNLQHTVYMYRMEQTVRGTSTRRSGTDTRCHKRL